MSGSEDNTWSTYLGGIQRPGLDLHRPTYILTHVGCQERSTACRSVLLVEVSGWAVGLRCDGDRTRNIC